MFISFNMFIGLIIVTIIMIALIIYLTFTGGKHNKTAHTKAFLAEEAAKERLAQNNIESPSQEPTHVNQHEFRQQSDLSYQHYHDDSRTEETLDEDPSLQILPYPKEDDFK